MTGSFCGLVVVEEDATGETSLIGADKVMVVDKVVAAVFLAFEGDLTGDDGADVAGEEEALDFLLLELLGFDLADFNISV